MLKLKILPPEYVQKVLQVEDTQFERYCKLKMLMRIKMLQELYFGLSVCTADEQ